MMGLFGLKKSISLKQEMFSLSGELIKAIGYTCKEWKGNALYMSKMIVKTS
jgi:hypothetical protein